MNKKKTVYMKNNTLIRSKYELTSSENKIYTFISNELRKQKAKNEDVVKIVFPREDLTSYMHSKKDSQPARLKVVFSKFRKRSIYIQEINDAGEEIWSEYGFINGFSYNVNRDEFTVEMNKKIHDLITKHYKFGYTPINVDAVFNLNSIYSQRFYELLRLKSWINGTVTYTVDEIKEYLCIEKKKSYNRYWNFKNKILDVAIDELNRSGLFNISYEEKRRNKTVVSITFIVEDLEGRKYFKDKDKKVVNGYDSDNLHIALCKAIDDMYVPNPLVFTKGALIQFKTEFVSEDFRQEYMERLFNEAVAITMEKDNVEIIGVKSYAYFSQTLKNKRDDYISRLITKQETLI